MSDVTDADVYVISTVRTVLVRAAGRAMYECGMRLGLEVGGLRSLQKQAKCYLAALNSLRLINPEYAWIVKPVTKTDDQVGVQIQV